MSHEYARWRWLIEIVQTDAATAGEPLDRRPFGHLALLIKAWDVADEHANGLRKRMRRRHLRNGWNSAPVIGREKGGSTMALTHVPWIDEF